MRIAVFGGSFDPLHKGHETIINKALESLEIDKLILIPTYLNPFKTTSHFDAQTRLDLLKKNFISNEKIIICDYEVKQNRSVSTYETINYLMSIYNLEHIYLIMGSDNYKSLHLWHNSEALQKLVEVVVATRDGFLNEDYGTIRTLKVEVDISSTQLRNNLNLNYIPKKIKEDVKKLYINKGKHN